MSATIIRSSDKQRLTLTCTVEVSDDVHGALSAHKVEDGSIFSDHFEMAPRTRSMRIMISETPDVFSSPMTGDAVAFAFDGDDGGTRGAAHVMEILQWLEDCMGVSLTILLPNRPTLRSCTIVEAPRVYAMQSGVEVQCRIQELRFVTSHVVDIAPDPPKKVKAGLAPPEKDGEQAPTPQPASIAATSADLLTDWILGR